MQNLDSKAKEGKINEDASIRDRQSVIINARIEKVWEVLTNVNDWPSWNPDIKSTKYEKLEVGAPFEWSLKGTHLKSSFQLIEEPTRIAWTGKSKVIKAIHVWELEASDEQTIVTVEESIEGFIVPVFNRNSKLHDNLLRWLSHLKQEAEK